MNSQGPSQRSNRGGRRHQNFDESTDQHDNDANDYETNDGANPDKYHAFSSDFHQKKAPAARGGRSRSFSFVGHQEPAMLNRGTSDTMVDSDDRHIFVQEGEGEGSNEAQVNNSLSVRGTQYSSSIYYSNYYNTSENSNHDQNEVNRNSDPNVGHERIMPCTSHCCRVDSMSAKQKHNQERSTGENNEAVGRPISGGYIAIPPYCRHGAHLECSTTNPEYKNLGRRFRYCAMCQRPIPKHHFGPHVFYHHDRGAPLPSSTRRGTGNEPDNDPAPSDTSLGDDFPSNFARSYLCSGGGGGGGSSDAAAARNDQLEDRKQETMNPSAEIFQSRPASSSSSSSSDRTNMNTNRSSSSSSNDVYRSSSITDAAIESHQQHQQPHPQDRRQQSEVVSLSQQELVWLNLYYDRPTTTTTTSMMNQRNAGDGNTNAADDEMLAVSNWMAEVLEVSCEHETAGKAAAAVTRRATTNRMIAKEQQRSQQGISGKQYPPSHRQKGSETNTQQEQKNDDGERHRGVVEKVEEEDQMEIRKNNSSHAQKSIASIGIRSTEIHTVALSSEEITGEDGGGNSSITSGVKKNKRKREQQEEKESSNNDDNHTSEIGKILNMDSKMVSCSSSSSEDDISAEKKRDKHHPASPEGS